jgi:hypothetical protein
VLINGGAARTASRNVMLTLWASDFVDPHLAEEFLPPEDSATGVQEMIISNFADFHDATWEPYATDKPWTLAQNQGLLAVYVKYRDAEGNESDVAVANILVSPLYLPFVSGG